MKTFFFSATFRARAVAQCYIPATGTFSICLCARDTRGRPAHSSPSFSSSSSSPNSVAFVLRFSSKRTCNAITSRSSLWVDFDADFISLVLLRRSCEDRMSNVVCFVYYIFIHTTHTCSHATYVITPSHNEHTRTHTWLHTDRKAAS